MRQRREGEKGRKPGDCGKDSCPQPDLQPPETGQLWGLLGNQGRFPPSSDAVHPHSCSLTPWLRGCGGPQSQAEWELQTVAEGHLGLLGPLQPSVSTVLSPAQQTIVRVLVFRPSHIVGPKRAPHAHCLPDTRKNHVGKGGPRALLFLHPSSEEEMEQDEQAAARWVGAGRLGGGRGRGP